jgi:drug/metabolite transporter (DMT)-like permease
MKTRISPQELFITGMVLSMTCWGFSWSSGKILSQYGDPFTLSLIRFSMTFVSLLLIVMMMKNKILIRKSGIVDLTVAASLLTIYTWLFFKVLMEGKAGAGGVLVTVLNPIVAYAITILRARRKPTRNEGTGLLLGLVAGLILLRVFTNAADIVEAGNIYFLLAAIVWALLSLFTARAGRHGSSVSFSFWLYGLSSLILLMLSGFRTSVEILQQADRLFWWNLFFSSTITTALATTFYFVATARVGASKASSFIFLVPFSAALGSWIFLNEKIEPHTIIGGVLGIAAVYILNKKEAIRS